MSAETRLGTHDTRYGLALAFVTGFFFSIRVSITFLWFQSNPQQGTVASTAFSILLFICACFVAVTNAESELAPANATLKVIFAYLALSGISVFWTVSKSAAVAAGYWLGTACEVLTLLLLMRYSPLEHRVSRVLQGYVAGAAVVAVIVWRIPAMYDSRLGNEDYLHPNSIGFVFALAALCSFYLSKQHYIWKWSACALSITLLRSLSKACIAAFLIAAAVYLLFGMKLDRRAKILIGLLASSTILFFWGLFESYYQFYAAGTSNVDTLTGRTLIWAESFDIACQAPWVGHGFYSYRFIVPPFGEFEAWHAHNELLQQFFNYGVIGVVVTVFLYYTFYRGIRSSHNNSVRALSVALLLFAIIRGTVDTERFDLSFPLWLMTMLSVPLFAGSHRPEVAGD
jgi:exopolysaccharide production protein ExoQ